MAVMENRKQNQGFTLIELVVVLAILAILAALIVGAIQISRRTQRNTQLRGDARTIKTALEGFYAKNRYFPSPVTGKDRMAYDMANAYLVTSGLIPSPMTNPSFAVSNQGTICYNMFPTPASGLPYYNLWVVSEEGSGLSTCTSCTVSGNPCSCGMSSVCGAEVFNGKNY